jgi:hypothetical protein
MHPQLIPLRPPAILPSQLDLRCQYESSLGLPLCVLWTLLSRVPLHPLRRVSNLRDVPADDLLRRLLLRLPLHRYLV